MAACVPVPLSDEATGTLQTAPTLTASAMLCFAVCLVSLASACDATSDYRTPSSDRKQRIVRAMSSGQALTLRLRGGGTAPNYRKERMLRTVASGQAVTMKLRGGDSSSPEAQQLLFFVNNVGSTTSSRRGEAHPQSGSAAVALVKYTASDGVGAADASLTRMDYRKRRILRAMSSGQAVTRRLYC